MMMIIFFIITFVCAFSGINLMAMECSNTMNQGYDVSISSKVLTLKELCFKTVFTDENLFASRFSLPYELQKKFDHKIDELCTFALSDLPIFSAITKKYGSTIMMPMSDNNMDNLIWRSATKFNPSLQLIAHLLFNQRPMQYRIANMADFKDYAPRISINTQVEGAAFHKDFFLVCDTGINDTTRIRGYNVSPTVQEYPSFEVAYNGSVQAFDIVGGDQLRLCVIDAKHNVLSIINAVSGFVEYTLHGVRYACASPDGAKIVCSVKHGAELSKLVIVNCMDGMYDHKTIDAVCNPSRMLWNPAGTHLAIQVAIVGGGKKSALILFDMQSFTITQKPLELPDSFGFLSWNPGGTLLSFNTWKSIGEDILVRILVIEATRLKPTMSFSECFKSKNCCIPHSVSFIADNQLFFIMDIAMYSMPLDDMQLFRKDIKFKQLQVINHVIELLNCTNKDVLNCDEQVTLNAMLPVVGDRLRVVMQANNS